MYNRKSLEGFTLRGFLTVILCLSIFSLATAPLLEAQVFTPTYQSPRMDNEFGVALSDGRGGFAAERIWRGGPSGVRVGYADSVSGVLMFGGELRNPLPIVGVPLGLAFTTAAQALLREGDPIGGSAGVSAGYDFMAPGMAITPYLHPRIGFFRAFSESDLRVRALPDVGADVEEIPFSLVFHRIRSLRRLHSH